MPYSLLPLSCKEKPTRISDLSYKHIGQILQLISCFNRTFANTNFSTMRVIIADDSKIILDRLHQMLVSMVGVEVVKSCSNGTEALTALHQLKPDMAILDNKMPGLNGIDVIKEIRKEDQKVKLMLLTFYANSYYSKQAMDAGADYFLSKSEDFDKIPELITGIIRHGSIYSYKDQTKTK